ncbi:hypothetical protein BC830DRAFT_1083792 [Chytriomyces sp. MP71]|nr:hypothetical protein BC830DRAFT_1083792 [Chytriomyces sp. MP71]
MSSAFFAVFAIICTLCALFIVEAMQAIPGNKHFQGTVEYATLVNFFFGPKLHLVSQFCLYGALITQEVAAIVMVAQILIVVTVPFTFKEMKDNLNLQIASFWLTFAVFLGWFINSAIHGFDASQIPTLPRLPSQSLSSLIGIAMLSFPFIQAVPSWINLKVELAQCVSQKLIITSMQKYSVNVQHTLWVSTVIAFVSYVAIGLIVISVMIATTFGRVLGYFFTIAILGMSIPAFPIMAYNNITQNFDVNDKICKLFTHVLPWIYAIPLMQGQLVSQFNVWTGLLFVSTANFVVPLLIYIQACQFRVKYNSLRELSDHQLDLLKKIHWQSKSIQVFIDNYPLIKQHHLQTLRGTFNFLNDEKAAIGREDGAKPEVKDSSDTLNGSHDLLANAPSKDVLADAASAALPHITLNSSQVLVTPKLEPRQNTSLSFAFSANSLAVPSTISARSSISQNQSYKSTPDIVNASGLDPVPAAGSSVTPESYHSLKSILAAIDPQFLDDVPDPELSVTSAASQILCEVPSADDFDDIMTEEECRRVRNRIDKQFGKRHNSGFNYGSFLFGGRSSSNDNIRGFSSFSQRQLSGSFVGSFGQQSFGNLSRKASASRKHSAACFEESSGVAHSASLKRQPRMPNSESDRNFQSIPEIFEICDNDDQSGPRRIHSPSFAVTPRSARSVVFAPGSGHPSANSAHPTPVSIPNSAISARPSVISIQPSSDESGSNPDFSRVPDMDHSPSLLAPTPCDRKGSDHHDARQVSFDPSTEPSQVSAPASIHLTTSIPHSLNELQHRPSPPQPIFKSRTDPSLHSPLALSPSLQSHRVPSPSMKLTPPPHRPHMHKHLFWGHSTLSSFFNTSTPSNEDSPPLHESLSFPSPAVTRDPSSTPAYLAPLPRPPSTPSPHMRSSSPDVDVSLPRDSRTSEFRSSTAFAIRAAARQSIQLPIQPGFVSPVFQTVPNWLPVRGKVVAQYVLLDVESLGFI